MARRTSRWWRVAAVTVTVMLAGCTASPAPPATATGPDPSAGMGTPPGGPPTITVLAAGDILLHPPVWDQARADGGGTLDFNAVFAGVRGRISEADLAVCHLETPLATPDGPFAGFPQFNVPPQIATTIAHTGFDTCSTASNHTLDAGEAGVYRTLDALDAAGVRHAGSYRDAAAAMVPNILEVKGVKVAQLSYTFGFNSGLSRPDGKDWIANQIDPAAIVAEARRARAAGAEIVLVSLHWGTEYDHNASEEQQSLAKQLLAAPEIDMILGCHAHVVQPFEKIGDKWVVYGMGNEIARHEDPVDASREGVMPRFTFTRTGPGHWRVTSADAIPTWVDVSPSIRMVDLPAAIAVTPSPTYQAAYDRISGYLRLRGADASSLHVVGPAGP